jgi:hypothetical protein
MPRLVAHLKEQLLLFPPHQRLLQQHPPHQLSQQSQKWLLQILHMSWQPKLDARFRSGQCLHCRYFHCGLACTCWPSHQKTKLLKVLLQLELLCTQVAQVVTALTVPVAQAKFCTKAKY